MRQAASVAALGLVLAACNGSADPTPTTATSPRETAVPTATPSPTIAATATATPEPTLSLDLPDETDERLVVVTAEPFSDDTGTGLRVEVTNESDERIDELVLRWPTDLAETVFLAPFVPDPELITEAGGNLVRPWTKWVIGPGEHGEPDGTTSLGYGPIEPGETLTMPLYATRNAEGAVEFDLQVLSGEEILALDGGDPAEVRVELP